MKYIYLSIAVLLIISCSDEHNIGSLHVNGISGVNINICQEDEFDSATAIYYEIVDDNGKTILKKSHLTGTCDYENGLSNFTANSYENIIYITYLDTNMVYAVYDLKTGKGYPHGLKDEDYTIISKNGNDLFETIKSHNENLKASWNE